MRKRNFGKAGKTVVLALGAVFLSQAQAQAATYNFYFYNNDHDTSDKTPSKVTITDTKGREDEILPQPPTPPGQSAAAASVAEPSFEPPGRGFRLGLGTVLMQQSGQNYNYNNYPSQLGGLVSLGYHFTQAVGLTGFIGDLSASEGSATSGLFGGAELEILPLRLSMGRFENLVELGPLVGVSTVMPADGNWLDGHVGARLNLNLGREWAITTVGRVNLAYHMVEAGVTFRL